ncbi:MAG: biotin--[acetyl-CoA-carboxylase] ligase [Caldilineaceae bacterium]
MLDLTALKAALQDERAGHTIIHYSQVPSTMPLAHTLADAAATRTGTIVVAEEQTAGRGRLARRWEAPAGQALLVSLILKPPLPALVAQLPLLAGLVARQAIVRYLPSLTNLVGLKWPNDLLLGQRPTTAGQVFGKGSGKAGEKVTGKVGGKVGGILIESAFRQTTPDYVIVGTGINVLQAHTALPPRPTPDAPPPVSLHSFLHETQITAPPLDRTLLLIEFCRSWSDMLRQPPLSPAILQQQWCAQLWTLGQMVSVRTVADASAPDFTGRAIEATAEGYLVVENEAGVRRTFHAGDVSLRGVDSSAP